MKRLILTALAGWALSGCTTMFHGGADISNIGRNGKKTTVVAENTLILGFGYDEDLIFKARKQLLTKCKKGATGISAVSEVTSYIIIGTQRITVEATCL